MRAAIPVNRSVRVALVVGSSSVVAAAAAMLRYKYVAVEVGSPGVAAMSVLLGFSTLLVAVGSVGLGASGVTALASASGSPSHRVTTQRALLRGAWLLALASGLVTLAALTPFDEVAGLELNLSNAGGISVAVAGGVASTIQIAVLNGLGRVRALAATTAIGSVGGTAAALLVLASLGAPSLAFALALVPVATTLTATFNLRKEYRQVSTAGRHEWATALVKMLPLGLTVAVAVVAGAGTQLVARVLVEARLGVAALGDYQASWVIANVYLSFVLGALAVEFLPRLSEVADDPGRFRNTIDEQIQVTVRMAAPFIVALTIAGPLVLSLLFSQAFVDSASLLRVYLMADVVKIPAWVLGFAFLAARMKTACLGTELVWNAVFLAGLIPLMSSFGLVGVGVAVILAFFSYAAMSAVWAAKRWQYVPSGQTLLLVLSAILVVGLVNALLMMEGPAYATHGAATLLGVAYTGALWAAGPVRLLRERRASRR